MLKIANAPAKEREILFRNTANKKNLHPAIVEKDFWVCFVLDYLFHKCEYKNLFVFKGGTSLSKAFHIIERFSEDIDLILDWRAIDYTEDEPYFERSKTAQDKYNKQMNHNASIFYKEKLVPTIQKDLDNILSENVSVHIDKSDEMVIDIEYPILFSEGYIRPEIRLEIGPLAQWLPCSEQMITSFVAEEYSEIFEFPAISVLTVDAARTFWEKSTILHKVANMPKEKLLPNRYARHYYDLYCFSVSKYKEEAFKRYELLEKDVAFKEKFYYTKSSAYETATLNDIKLIPPDFRITELRQDYEKMKNMFYGNIPSFDDIMVKIAELENEIHNLNVIPK